MRKNSEELSRFLISESVNREHLKEGPKTLVSLKDLPLELRKKEASKPIYLLRYE
jgi:hypothetical protein